MSHQHIINKFFRGNPMEERNLQELQTKFKTELTTLEGTKGCSRCKKNGLRKKYRNEIIRIRDKK
jgi:hypothetical protein